MTIRLISSTTSPGRSTPTCATCGERLIAYVPTCGACGAERIDDAGRGLGNGRIETRGARLRLAHLSDLHLGRYERGLSRRDALRLWLDGLRKLGADAVVISGDLVDDASDTASMVQARDILAASDVWWSVVPGNHDVREPGSPETFQQLFGESPRVVRRHGVSLILADSNAGLSAHERGLAERAFAAVGNCYTEGAVGPAQLLALDTQLGAIEDEIRILVMHHHLAHQHAEWVQPSRSPLPLPVKDQTGNMMRVLRDADLVHRWCVQRGVRFVLHGHQHQFLRLGVREGGVVVLNGGSSTEPPYRARLLDIDSRDCVRVHEVSLTV